jgi:hypothetical protein
VRNRWMRFPPSLLDHSLILPPSYITRWSLSIGTSRPRCLQCLIEEAGCHLDTTQRRRFLKPFHCASALNQCSVWYLTIFNIAHVVLGLLV